jgi:glucokinase
MLVVFNVGGTGCRVAGSKDGKSVAKISKETTPKTFPEGLKLLKKMISEAAEGGAVSAVGGGIAGVWDRNKSALLKSPNLPDWENKPIRKKLELEFKVPVVLENDAAMEGLGEACMGAGRKYQIVAYLCVGTGIGGTRIVDGKIDRRTWGFEPGHQIIFHEGRVGYWEDLASGRTIENIYKTKAENLVDPAAWKQELMMLAIGISNAMVFWSPQIIVLGGSVINKIDIEELKVILKQQNLMYPELPKIVKGELGDKAGLYGALELLRNHHTPGV